MPTRNVLVDTTTMQKHLILEEIFKIYSAFQKHIINATKISNTSFLLVHK